MTNSQIKIWVTALLENNKDEKAALLDIQYIYEKSDEFLKSDLINYIGKSRTLVIRELCNKYYPDNNKLQAVKDLKNIYSLGLKEAKDLIDSMWD